MKKSIAVIVLSFFFAVNVSSVALAAKNKGGPLPQRDANRRTPFNKMTDFFATVGKSENESKAIVNERKAQRRKARLNKEKRKRDALIKKEMDRQNKIIMEKVKAKDVKRYRKK